jgi:SpoVK/Ycf46/Vps4 family AAA+-type ATPase
MKLPAKTAKPATRAIALPAKDMAQVRKIAAAAKVRAAAKRKPLLFGGKNAATAAQALAKELALELYRVDLSRVVSKYIGETEKNLDRIFCAARDAGAVLLFDEADALLGKRSEVNDAHDRYQNIEINYLLQRMEAFEGLVILASKAEPVLPAALRRKFSVYRFPP